jgi:hypothetical protein
MRKCASLVLVLFVCAALSGCTILHSWIVKGDLKDLKGAYTPGSGEAGRADAMWLRAFLFTTEKSKPIIEAINLRVTVDNDNKTKGASIGTEVQPKEKEVKEK